MTGDDWSPLLSAARVHLGWDGGDATAALSWMAALLTPRVEAAFDADTLEVLDAAVDAVLREELPDALTPFAPMLRTALFAGADALWRHLTAQRMIEADVVRIVDVE